MQNVQTKIKHSSYCTRLKKNLVLLSLNIDTKFAIIKVNLNSE